MKRTISSKGLHFIKEHEGVELKVYKDVAGLPTIGVGHLLTQDELRSGKIEIMGAKVRYSSGISLDDAYSLLDQDLDRFESVVNRVVTVPLTQNKFDALVSLAFNIGVGAFAASTLVKVLNTGNYKEAHKQFARWIYSGGKIINGLINRRGAEQELWKNGYPENDKPVPEKKEAPVSQMNIVAGPGANFRCSINEEGQHYLELRGAWHIQ